MRGAPRLGGDLIQTFIQFKELVVTTSLLYYAVEKKENETLKA